MASTRRTFIRTAAGSGALILLGAPADVLRAAKRKLQRRPRCEFAQGIASG